MQCEYCGIDFEYDGVDSTCKYSSVMIGDTFKLSVKFEKLIVGRRSRRRLRNRYEEANLCDSCQVRVLTQALVDEGIITELGLVLAKKKNTKKKVKKRIKKKVKINNRTDILDL